MMIPFRRFSGSGSQDKQTMVLVTLTEKLTGDVFGASKKENKNI